MRVIAVGLAVASLRFADTTPLTLDSASQECVTDDCDYTFSVEIHGEGSAMSMPLHLGTWTSISEVNSPAYAERSLPPAEKLGHVDRTFSLGPGAVWHSRWWVSRIAPPLGGGSVGIIGGGPRSKFAEAHPLFALIPSISRNTLVLAPRPSDITCSPGEAVVHSLNVGDTSWMVEGSVQIGRETTYVDRPVVVATRSSVFLDSASWERFWAQVSAAGLRSTYLLRDDTGRRFAKMCPPALISKLPRITFSVAGGTEFSIGPDEYLFMGSLSGPDGSTFRIIQTDTEFNRPSIGAPFLRTHSVVFDKTNNRVGICRAMSERPYKDRV